MLADLLTYLYEWWCMDGISSYPYGGGMLEQCIARLRKYSSELDPRNDVPGCLAELPSQSHLPLAWEARAPALLPSSDVTGMSRAVKQYMLMQLWYESFRNRRWVLPGWRGALY